MTWPSYLAYFLTHSPLTHLSKSPKSLMHSRIAMALIIRAMRPPCVCVHGESWKLGTNVRDNKQQIRMPREVVPHGRPAAADTHHDFLDCVMSQLPIEHR